MYTYCMVSVGIGCHSVWDTLLLYGCFRELFLNNESIRLIECIL